MTVSQIWEMFKEYILPSVTRAYEMDGIPDKPARREAWNNYVESLRVDGTISYSAAENMDHPDELETYFLPYSKICQTTV